MTSAAIGNVAPWQMPVRRPAAADGRHATARARKVRAPLPVLVLIACFLAPTELSVYLAGFRLPPHRIALLLFVPFALWRFVSSSAIRLRAFDVLVAIYAAWTITVYMLHAGCAEGLQYGGSLALEGFGAFLVARAYIVSLETFQATVRALVVAVTTVLVIALPEAISGVHYVHDILRDLTGYVHPIGHEARLGLTRAYGTFDHPIHLGTFCASTLAMVWYADISRRARLARLGMIPAATVLGLSSAPILCLGLQGAFIGWDRLTRRLPHRLLLSLGAVALAYGLLSVVMTRTPLAFLATGFTLDPWTGFYRLRIWEHGLENVVSNPWIGIGLADWARPAWMASATVDAYWLVTAMRAGVPAFLIHAAIVVLIARAAIRRRRVSRSGAERQAALSWLVALTAISLVACTVHFWNVLHSYYFFFLGLAAWLSNPAPVVSPTTDHAEGAPRVRRPVRLVPETAWAR